MTTTKKQPSNGDIYRKLDSMDVRLLAVEKWQDGKDIATAAVKEFRETEAKERMDNIKAREGKAWIDILKQASIVLAILAAILYAYLQTRSIK